MIKSVCLFSLSLRLVLGFSLPALIAAHVGHGDEFQEESGINRVPVKVENDAILGIVVTVIAPAPGGVFIPTTSIVPLC